jgi:arsenate reductase-like glutaredoxin family protein
VGEAVDSNKVKQGREAALALARKARRLVAARGKKTVVLDVTASDDETLLGHLLGPTGNLRAPTIVVGDTLVVGFNEEAYRSVLEAG